MNQKEDNINSVTGSNTLVNQKKGNETGNKSCKAICIDRHQEMSKKEH